MEPYWTSTDGQTAWYRVHILEKNYSVKVEEDPFEDEGQITEIRMEWSGNKTVARPVTKGEEYDRVCAAYRVAKEKLKFPK